MTTIDALKDLSIAAGCGEATGDTTAKILTHIAEHYNVKHLKTVTGTSVHITDATNDPINSFSMSGYKNLFPDFIETKTYTNGSTVTVNDDGSITVHKVAGDTINQNRDFYLPAGVYTISSGLTDGSMVYFEFADLTNDKSIGTYGESTDTATFAAGTKRFYLYSDSEEELDVTLYPQLERSSTATEYTKYKSATVTVNETTFNYPLYETLPTLKSGVNDITNSNNDSMAITYYAR